MWAIAFFTWFRDDPRTHPKVNAAELAIMPPRAKARLPRSDAVGANVVVPIGTGCLALQDIALSLRLVFLYHLAAHVSPRSTRHEPEDGRHPCRLAAAPRRRWLPFLGLARASPGARRRIIGLARKIVAIIGFVGASASVIIFTRISDPANAMICWDCRLVQ